MKRTARLIIWILVAALVGLIAYRISVKVGQKGQRPRSVAYAVNVVPLAMEKVKMELSFTGTAEGDPQVKVYPQAGGKFWGNEVSEGSWVERNQTLANINRDIVGMNYQLATVRAPVAGMVKRLYYNDRGTTVTLDKPVAEITDPSKIKIVLNVGESDLPKIRRSMPVLITSVAETSNVLKGTVLSVTPFVDSDSLSGVVVVRAANPGRRLQVGSTVDIDIVIGERSMFMVPIESVLSKSERTFVYVNSNGFARQVDIVQGYLHDDMVEITGNLKEGDEIVTQGAFKLTAGAKIQTGEMKESPPPADAKDAEAGKKKTPKGKK